jgi:hypothetical protein
MWRTQYARRRRQRYMHTLDHSIIPNSSSVTLYFIYKLQVCATTKDKGMGKYKT